MDLKQEGGKIILINGASSAGKSTLAQALWEKLDEPFLYYSFDHFRAAEVLPMERIRDKELDWLAMRPAFFEGFHRSLAAFASAGNNLLVEHIVETEAWMDRLLDLLAPFEVFFIGVHCPLAELERREAERGDRRIGEARADYTAVHNHCQYDLELDSTEPADRLANLALLAWRNRLVPSAFERMAYRRGTANGNS
ncbi:MAG TPA: AAA family ATPase [Anaerolineae bacterium]|nr:AAA family ATPase [Anaerolineae bacterium]